MEDLYLKREREIPLDMVEDIEKQLVRVEKKIEKKVRSRKISSNNPLMVIK